MQLDLLDELCNACTNHCYQQAIEADYKGKEEPVVVSTNTGSKPDAVMVELANTIVAQVAMSCLIRPKNQTRFAKLERRDGSATKLRTVH